MSKHRNIKKIFGGEPVVEGAGVNLIRAFGHREAPAFDPFLMLDDFRSDNPEDYLKGFPWHPHRGIETVTYMLEGRVNHGDSMKNSGTISKGDVQWMTAGSGIIHQEMPEGDADGKMYGFQLWVNLPRSHKMMPPRYQELKAAEIPEVVRENAKIRVISGEVDGVPGPVKDIVVDPLYIDVTVHANSEFSHIVPPEYTALAYVYSGKGLFGQTKDAAENRSLVQFDTGEIIDVQTGGVPVRFLLIAGKPIGENVAWRGPIVMNTEEELRIAFEEFRNGTFIKK